MVYTIIFVVGVVGNGLLISSVLLRKRSTVANVFLVNLAASDLVSLFSLNPFSAEGAFNSYNDTTKCNLDVLRLS